MLPWLHLTGRDVLLKLFVSTACIVCSCKGLNFRDCLYLWDVSSWARGKTPIKISWVEIWTSTGELQTQLNTLNVDMLSELKVSCWRSQCFCQQTISRPAAADKLLLFFLTLNFPPLSLTCSASAEHKLYSVHLNIQRCAWWDRSRWRLSPVLFRGLKLQLLCTRGIQEVRRKRFWFWSFLGIFNYNPRGWRAPKIKREKKISSFNVLKSKSKLKMQKNGAVVQRPQMSSLMWCNFSETDADDIT